MRLQKYLNEGTGTYEDMVSLIKSNCQPFLKDGQGAYRYNFLYSGRRSSDDFDMKTVRKDRKPKDTPLEIHNFVDDWFYKKFGVRARSNAVFCSFDIDEAKNYGEAYMIFPIGKYIMLSSDRVKDLYFNLPLELRKLYGLFDIDNYESQIESGKFNKEDMGDSILGFLERANYKRYNFNTNEQMVMCKKYYMMHSNYERELRKDILR